MLTARPIRLVALAAFLAVAASPAVPALAAPGGGHAGPATLQNAGVAPSQAARPDRRYPQCGDQFTYTMKPNETTVFYTYGWSTASYVDWTVMDETQSGGGAAVSLTNVSTQNTGSGDVTYWLTVVNYTSSNQAIKGRYCFLG